MTRNLQNKEVTVDEGSREHSSTTGTPLGRVKLCKRGPSFCAVPEGSQRLMHQGASWEQIVLS